MIHQASRVTGSTALTVSWNAWSASRIRSCEAPPKRSNSPATTGPVSSASNNISKPGPSALPHADAPVLAAIQSRYADDPIRTGKAMISGTS